MSPSVPIVVRESGGQPPPIELERLWEEFGPPLRGFLARRVPPGVDADDLVQDVFLRVIRSLSTLRSTDRPEAWLFQIARNALRDSLRARLRKDGRTDPLDVDLPADPDVPADGAAAAELAPCLTAMVDRLAEPYRTAITLTSLQGLTQSDAARGHLDLRHEVARAARPGPVAPDAGDVLRHCRGRARRRLGLPSARTRGVRRAG
jgi:RNA polymerase sigma factor (sigma-70 family)